MGRPTRCASRFAQVTYSFLLIVGLEPSSVSRFRLLCYSWKKFEITESRATTSAIQPSLPHSLICSTSELRAEEPQAKRIRRSRRGIQINDNRIHRTLYCAKSLDNCCSRGAWPHQRTVVEGRRIVWRPNKAANCGCRGKELDACSCTGCRARWKTASRGGGIPELDIDFEGAYGWCMCSSSLLRPLLML